MDKRTFLAIILSLILVISYQYLFLTPPPEDVTEESVDRPPDPVDHDPSRRIVLPDRDTPSEPPPVQRSLEVPEDTVADVREIPVTGPLYEATLSTRGAGVASFRLTEYRQSLSGDAAPIELVNLRGNMHYPLTVTFPESNIDIPPDAVYDVDREGLDLTDGSPEGTIIFTWSYPGQIMVEKRYTFYADSYAVDLDVVVHNLSAGTIIQNAGILWKEYADPTVRTDRFSHTGPVAFVGDDVVTENLRKLDRTLHYGPEVLWAGYQSKYFIAAIIAQQPSLTSMTISQGPDNGVAVRMNGPRALIPPGERGQFRYTCYMGPKAYDILKEQDVFLEASIDFGSWIKWLALPLLKALQWINGYVHNYGLAIIILTIFIKILFWPLGSISYRSMKQMQKLQPEMMKIREKYKDDKAKIQEETMQLYRTYKVNPLSGCLPILIQIPVFFGLYRTLLYSIELRHSPFIFWIQDLSAKDPFYITPIVMGASMWLQMKMMPTAGVNELQAKIMTWMPVIFTFLFLNFPAGLVIYWLFNNILSMGQQYWINKRT